MIAPVLLSSPYSQVTRYRADLHFNLDLVTHHAGFKTVDFDAFVVHPGAVGDAESPGVPRARDDAIETEAGAERGAHVRADVVDGIVAAALVENRD